MKKRDVINMEKLVEVLEDVRILDQKDRPHPIGLLDELRTVDEYAAPPERVVRNADALRTWRDMWIPFWIEASRYVHRRERDLDVDIGGEA